MGKLGKVLLALAAIIIVVIVGLSLVVRFYLTEERLKAMVIPRAEQALGRQVSIGTIKVGLFKGISIEDFAVKEEDGKTDFVSTQSFILRYDLMPLLKKQVVVSEVLVENPTILIQRDKNGKFNYESLAVFKKSPSKKNLPSPAAGQAALPLALTVDQIRVQNAKITVRDAKGELPAVDAKADLKVGVDLAKNLKDLKYDGDLKFDATAVHGEATVKMDGTSRFDREKITLKSNVALDQEKLKLDGLARNYMTTPEVKLDITSQALNFDHLAAILAGPPAAAHKKSQTAQKTSRSGKKEPIGKSIPSGLVVHGDISVAKVLYKKLVTNNFFCTYRLANGLFTIKGLSALVADGKITGETEANLMQPDLTYKGRLDVDSLQVAALRDALAPKSPADVAGALGTSLTFSGAGTEMDTIKKTLLADGQFAITNAHIRNTEISQSVANLLDLQEINNLTFKDVSGKFRVVNGDVVLNSQMSGSEISAKTQGTVGLDGSLNLPVTLTLSQALSDKLKQRASFTKYLADEQGKTVLHLKLAGSVKKPRPSLDATSVKQQTEKVIKQKLLQELDKALGPKEGEQQDQQPNPAKEILRNLFGQ